MPQPSSLTPIDFIRTRRSVVAANICEPGPTHEDLELIIESGLRVPDHSRCGPWRLQIIDKEGQAALGDLYARLYSEENKDATLEQIEYWRLRPSSAPCLIIILLETLRILIFA